LALFENGLPTQFWESAGYHAERLTGDMDINGCHAVHGQRSLQEASR
jgi:hypothetical protein